MEFKYDLDLPKPFVKDSVRAVLCTILFHRMLGSVVPKTGESKLGVSFPMVVGEGGAELDALVEEKASLVLRALEASAAATTGGSAPGDEAGVKVTADPRKRNQRHAAAVVEVQFLSKRPAAAATARKSGWFGSRVAAAAPAADQDAQCWEKWVLCVRLVDPHHAASSSLGSSPSSLATSPQFARLLNPGGGVGSSSAASSPASAHAHAHAPSTSSSPSTSSTSTAGPSGGSAELIAQASRQLQSVLLGIVTTANKHRDYIPPITTTEVAPFPYEIVVYPSDLQGNPITAGEAGAGGGAGGDESWGSVLKKILDS